MNQIILLIFYQMSNTLDFNKNQAKNISHHAWEFD